MNGKRFFGGKVGSCLYLFYQLSAQIKVSIRIKFLIYALAIFHLESLRTVLLIMTRGLLFVIFSVLVRRFMYFPMDTVAS